MARKKKIAAEAVKKVIGKKSSRGKKRIRGRPSKEVKEVMEKEGVGRREAEEIIAARKKDKAKAKQKKPTEAQAKEIAKWAAFKPTGGRVSKRWGPLLKEQKRQMRETDPNYVPPGGSSPGLRKEYVGDKATGAEKLKYFNEFGERIYNPVEEGPPLSKVKLPTGLSQAQKRRLKMTGQAKSVAKSSKYPEGIKGTGEYAPPASYIHDMMGDRFKEGVTEPQVKELMELVESGKLTLKKKGGSIKSKKTKRKSASKPRGVGKAMRGWGATMKRRT